MKIVQVLNTIITNQKLVSNVLRNEREYFFIYDNKYKWSILKGDKSDNYFVHFYPTEERTLEQLAYETDWQEFTNFVTYSTEDLKTKEAQETFTELYQIVATKVFGIDDMFDDILGQKK